MMNKFSQARRRTQGFTLLELVVAAVLTSLLLLMMLQWIGALGHIAQSGSGNETARTAHLASVRFSEDIENADSCDRLRRDGPISYMSGTEVELFRDSGSVADGLTPDGHADLIRWKMVDADTDPSPDAQDLELIRTVTFGDGTCNFATDPDETAIVVPGVRDDTTTIFSPVADGQTISLAADGITCRTTSTGVQDPAAWQLCAWDGVRMRVVLDGSDSVSNLLDFFTPLNLAARRTPEGAGSKRTVAGAPTIISITGSDAQVTVAFNAPASNGGSTITGYTARSEPGDVTVSGTTSPLVVTGLTNGTSYTFTVAATNGEGIGADSDPSGVVVPGALVPEAPTIDAVTPGNTNADVAFTAPSFDGGSPLIDYTVTSSPGGLTCTVETPAASCIVAGLTNGSPYQFVVRARNAIGAGAASAQSAPVSPLTTPGSPTIGTATIVSQTSANVTFAAPASNGGSALTSYTVTAYPGAITATGSGSPIVVSGLTAGGTYTFKATATNAAGNSTESASSNPVALIVAPDAPNGFMTATMNDRNVLSWTALTNTAGQPVVGYKVYRSDNPSAPVSTQAGTVYNDTDVINATSYTYTVAGYNTIGDGPQSSPTVIVAGAPTTASAFMTALDAKVYSQANKSGWTATASVNMTPSTDGITIGQDGVYLVGFNVNLNAQAGASNGWLYLSGDGAFGGTNRYCVFAGIHDFANCQIPMYVTAGTKVSLAMWSGTAQSQADNPDSMWAIRMDQPTTSGVVTPFASLASQSSAVISNAWQPLVGFAPAQPTRGNISAGADRITFNEPGTYLVGYNFNRGTNQNMYMTLKNAAGVAKLSGTGTVSSTVDYGYGSNTFTVAAGDYINMEVLGGTPIGNSSNRHRLWAVRLGSPHGFYNAPGSAANIVAGAVVTPIATVQSQSPAGTISNTAGVVTVQRSGYYSVTVGLGVDPEASAATGWPSGYAHGWIAKNSCAGTRYGIYSSIGTLRGDGQAVNPMSAIYLVAGEQVMSCVWNARLLGPTFYVQQTISVALLQEG